LLAAITDTCQFFLCAANDLSTRQQFSVIFRKICGTC
jgi:hypothetical protein